MNKYTNNLSIILLITLSQSALAQIDSTVYKWVDEKKQVNYTDRPAPGRAETTNIEDQIRKAAGLPSKKVKTGYSYNPRKTNTTSPSITADKKTKSNQKDTATDQASIAEDYAKKLNMYCKQQSGNLTVLLGDTPIAWEEEGKTILLSADQRKEKISSLKSSIADKCPSKK